MQYNLLIRKGTCKIEVIQDIISRVYKAASCNDVTGFIQALISLHDLDKNVKFTLSERKSNKIILNNVSTLVGEEVQWVVEMDTPSSVILFNAPMFAAGRNNTITGHLIKIGEMYKLYPAFDMSLLMACDGDLSIVNGVDLCVNPEDDSIIIKEFLGQQVIGDLRDTAHVVHDDKVNINAIISILLHYAFTDLRAEQPDATLGELIRAYVA